jgi:hypothetical protein
MPVTRKRKQANQAQSQSSQPTRTHLEFSTIIKYQAFHRQWSRCAHCGKNLTIQVGHAHHVIPAQTGNRSKPADTFLRSVDNCVILCNHCYQEVAHSGNYGENTIASPSLFRYTFGLEKTFHQQWVNKLTVEQQRYSAKHNATVTMLH